jgi:hypothetical protein
MREPSLPVMKLGSKDATQLSIFSTKLSCPLADRKGSHRHAILD